MLATVKNNNIAFGPIVPFSIKRLAEYSGADPQRGIEAP